MENFNTSDGVQLGLDRQGAGTPVIFQHGLCGDASQPASVFPDMNGFERLTLECRAHGSSEVGSLAVLSIAQFTTDLEEMIVSQGLHQPVVGGISMGAAISLRLAVKRPHLVKALILARPAWLTKDNPKNLAPYAYVGQLLMEHCASDARLLFEQSSMVQKLSEEAPDNLISLRSFFNRTPIDSTVALLRQISSDGLGISEDEVRALRLPVLVIGSEKDNAHPISYAHMLTQMIPGAHMVEITPKSIDPDAYCHDFNVALAQFLKGL